MTTTISLLAVALLMVGCASDPDARRTLPPDTGETGIGGPGSGSTSTSGAGRSGVGVDRQRTTGTGTLTNETLRTPE